MESSKGYIWDDIRYLRYPVASFKGFLCGGGGGRMRYPIESFKGKKNGGIGFFGIWGGGGEG